VAKGSCGEVRAQLYVARDQQYIDKGEFDRLSGRVVQVSRLIAGLIKYLRQSEYRGSKFK
jgi:four helix bundle protein